MAIVPLQGHVSLMMQTTTILRASLHRCQIKMPPGLRPEGICARDEIRTHPAYQLVMIAVRRLLAGLLVENKTERLGKACRIKLEIFMGFRMGRDNLA